MISLVRTNPGLLIWIAILGIAALVCLSIGVIMARAGASVRPIQWFAGFMLLIGLPQFFAHLYLAINTQRTEAPRTAALETLSASTDSNVRNPAAKLIFGPNATSELITDARQITGGALTKALSAQFAVLPTGESVLLAKFNGYSDAEKAWVQYLRDTGLNQLEGKGHSQKGYAVTRPAGDRAYVLHLHNMLGVWTAPDDQTIRNRMIAGGFRIPRGAPLATDSSRPVPANVNLAQVPATPFNGYFMAAATAVLFIVVVLYFFKGAAWAGSVAPQTNTQPASLADVASRLESINDLDAPFHVTRGTQSNEFFVTWRYADAKWIDLARARGKSGIHRIKLVLDGRRGVARATDMFSRHDWSVGRGGADLEWKTGMGIVFFQYEHQRVFGLQLDEQGRFKPELSYAYTFNLQEMKAPLIAAITRAGWTWRPVVWQGPTWLRWLTE